MIKFTTRQNRLYINGKLLGYMLSAYKAETLAQALNSGLADKRKAAALAPKASCVRYKRRATTTQQEVQNL